MENSEATPPYWLIRPTPAPDCFTVPVYGLGRSGTTMVARVLTALGVDMGAHLTPRKCEDRLAQVLLWCGDLPGFEFYRDRRNQEKNIWGFKVPALRNHVTDQVPKLRNPRPVVTLRDPLAVGLRLATSLDKEVPSMVMQSATKTLAMLTDLQQLDCPVMLVSYEKAVQQPEVFVRGLAEFCGLSPSQEEVASVVRDNVIPGDPRYFKKGRVGPDGQDEPPTAPAS